MCGSMIQLFLNICRIHPTSRKDATPRCPSSSRFIQEHLALQCRNRNPLNNPGACLKYPTDSSQSPQSRNGSPLVHSKWRHLRQADEAWRLRSAGGWDVAKSEVMRKSGAGHKTWQPSRAPSWGGGRTCSSHQALEPPLELNPKLGWSLDPISLISSSPFLSLQFF